MSVLHELEFGRWEKTPNEVIGSFPAFSTRNHRIIGDEDNENDNDNDGGETT